jgi:hypothetical protein
MQKTESKWYGWVILALIVGAIIWSQVPDKRLTPAQERVLQQKADASELRQAKEKCADVEDLKLFNACVEIERKRISDAYDEKALEQSGR